MDRKGRVRTLRPAQNPHTWGMVTVQKVDLINLLFGGGVALAGLILVFLGGVISAFDSFDETAKDAVRGGYRRRAWLGFSGFVLSLSSAGSALIAARFRPGLWIACSFVCLAVAFLLVFVAALQAVRDIG